MGQGISGRWQSSATSKGLVPQLCMQIDRYADVVYPLLQVVILVTDDELMREVSAVMTGDSATAMVVTGWSRWQWLPCDKFS